MAEAEINLTERIMEFQRREYALLSTMAQREREMRKLQQQASEAANAFEDTQKDSLRGAFVDPAVNLELAMLRQRLRDKDQEASKLREECNAAQFQPNSIQGQKLLQKCAHLLEENAELARTLGEDRLQALRIQITAERTKRLQLRTRISEFERWAEKVDAENEGMQKKIADVGNSMREERAKVEALKKELEDIRSGVKRKRDKGKHAAPEAADAVEAAETPPPPPVASPPAAQEEEEASPKKSKKEKRHSKRAVVADA